MARGCVGAEMAESGYEGRDGGIWIRGNGRREMRGGQALEPPYRPVNRTGTALIGKLGYPA